MKFSKEQMLKMNHGDVVYLVKWRIKDEEKIIISKTNALFNCFLDNGKASFVTFACRPKNYPVEDYGVSWEVHTTRTKIR